MKTTSHSRVALYARVSNDHQADGGTIVSQVAALKQRIAADGGHIEPELEFLDDGYSGALLLRPALERLRDQAAQGAIDRLYVHSPDRLARNYAYQVLVLDELRRAGVSVVFLNHALGKSPEDDLLLQVQGVIAEYERAKISERSRRGKLHAARQGRVSVLSAAPYGYRYVSKQPSGGEARYEIVAEQARVVQQVFTWVGRDRLSLNEVRRRLHQQGVPSPTGQARWPATTLAQLLKNSAYQGQAGFGKHRRQERLPRLRPRRGQPEVPRHLYSRVPSEPIFVPVPALVSADEFAAAAEQMAENQRRCRQRQSGARYLLQGLVVCGGCGYAWYGLTNKNLGPRPYAYYRCCGRRSADPLTRCHVPQLGAAALDQAVWTDVCALLQHPHKLEEEYQRRLHDQPGAAQQRGLEPLQRVIAKVKRGISRLVDLYSEGLMEKSELEPRLQAAQERLQALEAEASNLSTQAAQQAELRLALTHLQDFAAQVQQGLDQADWTSRREIIRALVKRIEINDGQVRIVYRVAPVPFADRPCGGILQHCTWRQGRQPLHATVDGTLALPAEIFPKTSPRSSLPRLHHTYNSALCCCSTAPPRSPFRAPHAPPTTDRVAVAR
jgi:site-specific DNA recombinase